MKFYEAVAADRKRRNLSRRAYAELTGLTEGKVQNAEKEGVRVKVDTIEKLKPYVQDLLDPELGGPQPHEADTGEPIARQEIRGGDVPTPGESTASDLYTERRARLVAAYEALQARLDGRPAPPFGLPSHYRVDTCPPEDFARWHDWIIRVHAWLDDHVGEGQTARGEACDSCDPGEPDWDFWDEDWTDEAEPAKPGTTLRELNPELVDAIEQAEKSVAEAKSSVRDLGEPAPGDPDPQSMLYTHPHGWGMQPGDPEHAASLTANDDGFEFEPGVRYITNSELQTFKDCQRKWWLGHYRKLGLPMSEITGARSIGTRVHAALAGYYRPELPVDPFAILKQTIDEDRAKLFNLADADGKVPWDGVQVEDGRAQVERVEKALQSEYDMCHAILEGYFLWLNETGADQFLQVVGSEQRVTADPLMDGLPNVRLLTKQDARLLRSTDRARLFMDHKTVQEFTTPTKTLHMDEQMLLYHLVEYLNLLAAGEDADATRTDGALYNMLRKVKRSGQAKPPFYDRKPINHNKDTLRSFYLRVRGTIAQIVAAEARLASGMDHREAVPARPNKDCSWKCDFFAVCSLLDDGSRGEDMLNGVYVQVNPLDRYLNEEKG